MGFDTESGEVKDLVAAGVLDSARALSDALALAFAYAEGILKTAAWDTSRPERKDELSVDAQSY
jgi:chaperonin GroEL (HSP60 family)